MSTMTTSANLCTYSCKGIKTSRCPPLPTPLALTSPFDIIFEAHLSELPMLIVPAALAVTAVSTMATKGATHTEAAKADAQSPSSSSPTLGLVGLLGFVSACIVGRVTPAGASVSRPEVASGRPSPLVT
jgi:hypothetical protein